ncbi:hypothetical protein DFH28DRAFT_1221683 [Melampsora americana]|nr:hypothetical protein DFH28DRAFT_1221683 [Melampsora americana]
MSQLPNQSTHSTSIGIYNLVPFSNTTAATNHDTNHQRQQRSNHTSEISIKLKNFKSTSNSIKPTKSNYFEFDNSFNLNPSSLSKVDFFHALFSSHWHESNLQESVSIKFPSQVNRSAFEYCLAYIYGNPPSLIPPPLVIYRNAIRSPPNRFVNLVDEESAWEELLMIPDLQPASPYLSNLSLAQDTVKLIRKTITPFTIIRYLTFADGRSIDDEVSDLERDASCRTLEQIKSNLNSESHHDPIEGNLEDRDESLSYGALAQQIGQACASWLSKWSTELLSLEEVLLEQDEDELLPIGINESRVLERWPWLKRPEMRLWRQIGGLPSKWIRVLISSDALFISRDICGPLDQSSGGTGGEWERYGLARRISPDPELARIFDDGIYFSHLTFEQLSLISTDRSSISKQKFVTSKSLQRAHWLATEFQGKVDQPSSLTRPINEICQDDLPVYFFFGLGRDMITSLPIPTYFNSTRLFTRFEPKRFSAEFVNLSRLRDRGRLYSLPPTDLISPNTILYAGSKFSCYLQRVRQDSSPEPQLGVYVHRLSEGIEQEQERRVPSVGTHSLFGEGSRLRSALGPRSLVGPIGDVGNRNTMNSNQFTNNHLHHHHDEALKGTSNGKNGVIEAYFVLRVGTMDGTSGTVFESAPDGFAKSQSWGYRSKSMMGEEYLGVSSREIEGINGIERGSSKGEEVKRIGKHSVLRCTVVIGLT